jgi:Fur family ferric uptake transcriptional regulator
MPEVIKLKVQRNTSQRRLLLDLLNQSEGHLDADELFRLAKEREPRISLSTVYRNLSLFKELGLIQERHLADEHHHYEVKGKREHYHLVCLNCGKVVEFQSPLAKRMKEDISKRTGFEILDGDIRLNGYCERCCRERKDEKR